MDMALKRESMLIILVSNERNSKNLNVEAQKYAEKLSIASLMKHTKLSSDSKMPLEKS